MEDPPNAAGSLQQPRGKSTSPKMLFSDLYRSSRSPLSRLRHSQPQPLPTELSPDYVADLVSKDKNKQKQAVKKYLSEKVRNDWDFSWPAAAAAQEAKLSSGRVPSPPESSRRLSTVDSKTAAEAEEDETGLARAADSGQSERVASSPSPDLGRAIEEALDVQSTDGDSETASTYSTLSEDPLNYRPRADWTSEASEDDEQPDTSPFRFDSPDAVGTAVKARAEAKKARQRRAARKQCEWNPGLACFIARRDAWTGARTVRVKAKPPTPISPPSGRRFFWRSHHHSKSTSSAAGDMADGQHAALSPTSSHTTGPHESRRFSGSPPWDSDFKTPAASPYPVETLLPLPPPILPPANPMRSSISPALYLSLYEKIVVQSLQPSCPINLADMVRSCVAGWKRDGEWPPRDPPAAAVIAVRRKKNQQRQDRRASAGTTASGGRRLSFGFLGRADREDRDREKDQEREKDGEEGVVSGKVRRGLQRVFGVGAHVPSPQFAVGAAKGDNAEVPAVPGAAAEVNGREAIQNREPPA